jgi:hypothetical protein
VNHLANDENLAAGRQVKAALSPNFHRAQMALD